jgi:hypothetical protein
MALQFITLLVFIFFASLSWKILETYYYEFDECMLYYATKREIKQTDVELGFLCWED